jgi:trehalose 6-phosphate synthase/phosphatase
MSRWITVANRLPFSLAQKVGAGPRKVTTASGGLVSALSGVRTEGERLWIGCAPDGLTAGEWPELQKSIPSGEGEWQYQPVFAEKSLYDSYYDGFCNDVLWPMLHYQTELVDFDIQHWNAYKQVNEMIAKEIAQTAKADDLIWIHDYHLFLVPKILKALRPDLKIGFFLHVPFPSSEIFRQLPVREEILDSLLHADLVGFHDYSYLRHFGSCLLRILGVESNFLSVVRGGHTTKLGVFPVSIDTEHFVERTKDAKVRALGEDMERPYFMFLGVDRLDYMKGLDLKLKAFQTLLRRFPQYKEKVGLLQVAVPTRQGVPVYNELARETARLVGEINGEFSTPNWSPIHYIHASVSFDRMLGLYRAADGLLVSSKRDGMNLVALEYVASQDLERPGVVLLSEFAGAISTLSHSIPLNPWDLEDTARKMQLAMEMPLQERAHRMKTMQDFLNNYTATDWAQSFISTLQSQEIEGVVEGPQAITVSDGAIQSIKNRIIARTPKRMTIFVDYDGTLVPIENTPEKAVMTEQLRQDVQALRKYPWLDIVVVSGRDSRFLSNQFDGLPVYLAAEHGAMWFDPNPGRWLRRIHRSRKNWYPTALKIVSDYSLRTPHSQVEKKHFAVAWHYRQSPNEFGEFQARKLAEELELGLANLPVNILRGKKVIEVRAIEADKGVFANFFLEEQANHRHHDAKEDNFVLALGDDRTDEDLFQVLHHRGLSVRVGHGPSAADYSLASQNQVMPFLKALCASLDSTFQAASSQDPDGEKPGSGVETKVVKKKARGPKSLLEMKSPYLTH